MVLCGVTTISIGGGNYPSSSEAELLRKGPGVYNHPVFVVPSANVAVPRDWPLDSGGRVTCLTCHAFIPTAGGAASASLRDEGDPVESSRDAPDVFCANCHATQDEGSTPAVHWRAMEVAHLKSEDRLNGRHLGFLDAASSRCLACHDGLNASDAENTMSWNRSQSSMGQASANHPIGVRYPPAGTRDGGSAFRPVSLLSQRILLPSGMVSCISCHDLYSKKPYGLTVPIDGSALCFACHDI
jgi:predicted CXXCH cytochrome family protein